MAGLVICAARTAAAGASTCDAIDRFTAIDCGNGPCNVCPLTSREWHVRMSAFVGCRVCNSTMGACTHMGRLHAMCARPPPTAHRLPLSLHHAKIVGAQTGCVAGGPARVLRLAGATAVAATLAPATSPAHPQQEPRCVCSPLCRKPLRHSSLPRVTRQSPHRIQWSLCGAGSSGPQAALRRCIVEKQHGVSLM